jgi:dephospho-CoA kinase|uniref:dephospho-CoA kinase n=1 Tax=Candidatus Planktophila sp. TaxID=2175601 RepID=UPI0040494DE8
MLVVALTGGIGAGKSLVAQYFSELGARVVDADQLSRVAIERGSEGFDEVITRFGESILRNGDIDRKALGEIIFKDKSAKADLEAIIHPRVRELFFEVVNDLAADEILIYEIPLLVETGAAGNFDQIITVEADLEIRKTRLLKRGMFISEIESRLAAQASPAEREAIATHIIENSGDEDQLLRKVENLWEELQRLSK